MVHPALVWMHRGASGISPEGLPHMKVQQALSTSLVARILLGAVWLGLAAWSCIRHTLKGAVCSQMAADASAPCTCLLA